MSQPEEWNRLATHPMQAWEWGEFRKETGVGVVRYGIYKKNKLITPIQVTIHKLPITKQTIGYFPKGELTKEVRLALKKIAEENKCVYIKCEPLIKNADSKAVMSRIGNKRFVRGRSLFTKYNFVLDLAPSEEELLKQMKQKTRYNIRLAERKGVKVEIDNSEKAFERYLELTEETTKRQGFYAHSPKYHTTMWRVLGNKEIENDSLVAKLLVAKYKKEIITTWILFSFNDTLYYPYGASTREHRNLMANNLVMWEAIKLAKRKGLKYLDMWGALGRNPDKSDAWYGFHRFKEGYGAEHVEYLGTIDYVAAPLLYYPLRMVESIRWMVLRIVKKG